MDNTRVSTEVHEKEWQGMDERDRIRAIVGGPLVRSATGELWLLRRREGGAGVSWGRSRRSGNGRRVSGLQFCNVRTDECRQVDFSDGEAPSRYEVEKMTQEELEELFLRSKAESS